MVAPDVDSVALALRLAGWVAPHLGPAAEWTAEKVGEGIAKAVGQDVWNQVKGGWKNLWGKVEQDEDARRAAEKLAAEPESASRQRALAAQMEQLLEGDGELVRELAPLVHVELTVSGSGAAALSLGSGYAISAGERGAVHLTQIQQQNIHLYLQTVVDALAPAVPGLDVESAMRRYLENLLARYTHLEFRGMGVNEMALHMPLLDVYVPGKVHAQLPEGDSPDRSRKSSPKLRGLVLDPAEREAIGAQTELRDLGELAQSVRGLVVLGDPGSGKTTFLKYLALRLARGEGQEFEQRLPVLASLATYARGLAEKPSLSVSAFLAGLLQEDKVPAADQVLGAGLAAGRMLILLDGLDEVTAEAARSTVVARVRDFFLTESQRGNRFVITSRIVGYREVRLVAPGVMECTLADFEPREIEEFVTRWTSAVEALARGAGEVAARDAQKERESLLVAIKNHPSVRMLAGNPLLLTILALVKRQGVELPRERAALYHQYIHVLVRTWNLATSLSGESRSDRDVRDTTRVLSRIALWMQETSPGRSEVAEAALLDQLAACLTADSDSGGRRAAEEFLDNIRRETALLIDRGGRRFGFIHPTFQEYLAAVALVDRAQLGITRLVEELSKRIPDPAWREVCLLAVAELARERDEAAGAVLEALLASPPGKPGGAQVFVGQAAWNAGEKRLPAEVRQRVVAALLETMGDTPRVVAVTRVEAGETLALLGAPQEVTTLAGMQFCTVPAGPFWFGEGKTIRQVELPSFAMARFPVTVAQFQEYVDRAHGGVWPGDKDALRGPANTPVVWVNWHEATAFCEWLTKTWRAEGRIQAPTAVCLPSEVQWEKAARGGLEVPAPRSGEPWRIGHPALPARSAANAAPKREYPWEEAFEADRANSREAGVDRVSPAGCFPRGQSPYAIQDLAGNVWEWTRSKPKNKPQIRALRGGPYFDVARGVRCAGRYGDRAGNRGSVIGFRLLLSPFPL